MILFKKNYNQKFNTRDILLGEIPRDCYGMSEIKHL